MAQGITLEYAIKVFKGELGCGDGDDNSIILDHIRAAIEFMLFNGGGDILREWIVTVRNGRFALPRDLETPIKYKCGRKADLGFGTIHSSFYPYSSQSVSTCCGYQDGSELNINLKANRVSTQYHPPKQGLRLIATTRDDRDVGKKIMVNGKRCGDPLAPTHNGHNTSGELLTIYKEDDNNKKYGAWVFDEITGVVKDPTCAYVMLSGIDTVRSQFHFLSHYAPDETIPRYTEGELHACSCNTCDFHLHVLGRIATYINYTRDEEVLPISSIEILRLLAKRARYDESGDFKEVQTQEQRIKNTIKRQVAYQQAANRHMSMALAASGATLSNV